MFEENKSKSQEPSHKIQIINEKESNEEHMNNDYFSDYFEYDKKKSFKQFFLWILMFALIAVEALLEGNSYKMKSDSDMTEPVIYLLIIINVLFAIIVMISSTWCSNICCFYTSLIIKVLSALLLISLFGIDYKN
ncbi:hypothetical protein BCR32DRAFT_251252 [Anaeromyces robustus]|uniref:Uncharacterized protein n=1 Tax=Anaeromyces robustus TaxID=1754192 RepID=A0A1Y1VTX6_9FUNG|nr:hypothetical protein BCR32DRAFT_288149 [Anaeromyces robustus]ORX64194.1 hypothetical protein BCR32DRAFT_251252 [Anaeromyces robustus]|eukprot:ORX51000.1 hypothetical protein BCR32DRAFT_288149 [Anaeromyces robustus]